MVPGHHRLDRDNLPRPFGGLQVDHALPAPSLKPIGVDLGALPHPRLGHHEQGRVVARHHHHADHLVILTQTDAPDPFRDPTHHTCVRLAEANRKAVARREDHLIVTAGDLNIDEFVPLTDVDPDQAHRAHISVCG